MEGYISTWKNAFNTQGRATRGEYWQFFLINMLIAFILGVVDGISGTTSASGEPLIATLFNVLCIVPTITIGIRRLHDMDYVGWWLLFPFVILAL